MAVGLLMHALLINALTLCLANQQLVSILLLTIVPARALQVILPVDRLPPSLSQGPALLWVVQLLRVVLFMVALTV